MTSLERALVDTLNKREQLEESFRLLNVLLAEETGWASAQDEPSCDTCAWWTRSDELHARYGVCRLAGKPTSNDPLFVVAAGPGAQAPSGELRTNEDFSCACYKPPPTTDA